MKTLSVFPLFFNDQRHKHLERGYKVDLYNLIKASWVCVDHILPNWETIEILRELSAHSESGSHLENYAKWFLSEELNYHTASQLTKNVNYYKPTYEFEGKRGCIHC